MYLYHHRPKRWSALLIEDARKALSITAVSLVVIFLLSARLRYSPLNKLFWKPIQIPWLERDVETREAHAIDYLTSETNAIRLSARLDAAENDQVSNIFHQ